MNHEASKKSVILPREMLEEMKAEALRQGRSLSRIVQHAFKIAKSTLKGMPAAPGQE
jgi:uncharacterized small protein (TIGR04563 family)